MAVRQDRRDLEVAVGEHAPEIEQLARELVGRVVVADRARVERRRAQRLSAHLRQCCSGPCDRLLEPALNLGGRTAPEPAKRLRETQLVLDLVPRAEPVVRRAQVVDFGLEQRQPAWPLRAPELWI